MNKNKKVEVHVELRIGQGEVIKPEKARVDVYALVESRSGHIVRWFYEKENAERELAKHRG